MFLENILRFAMRTWNDPDLLTPLKSFSIVWLLPGLLIGGTLNQQAWSTALLIIGQIVSASSLFAATIIVWSTYREKKWPLAIFAGIIISKVGRIIMDSSSEFYSLYTVFFALLFCFAGAVIALQKPQVIYRQVIYLCLISVPLMILQIAGVGEWTQILRTDFHGAETIAQTLALFKYDNLIITTSQARPAGFFWSNNFLSIVIMFGLGLHFGRFKTGRLMWQDFTLCAIAVLAMAKIVFLTFLVIVGWRFFTGDNSQKQKIKKVIILFLSLCFLYAIFFPGIFIYNTSANLLVKNFKGRFNDLAFTIESKSSDKIHPVDHESKSSDKIHPVDHESKSSDKIHPVDHESGYSSLVENPLPYFIIALFFLLPFYFRGLKEMKIQFSEFKDTTILLFFVVLLIPLVTSFLEGAVFWFIAGFAFVPLLLNAGLIHSDKTSPNMDMIV